MTWCIMMKPPSTNQGKSCGQNQLRIFILGQNVLMTGLLFFQKISTNSPSSIHSAQKKYVNKYIKLVFSKSNNGGPSNSQKSLLINYSSRKNSIKKILGDILLILHTYNIKLSKFIFNFPMNEFFEPLTCSCTTTTNLAQSWKEFLQDKAQVCYKICAMYLGISICGSYLCMYLYIHC